MFSALSSSATATVCVADNILVVVGGETSEKVTVHAKAVVEVVRRIHEINLNMVRLKTEAVFFYGKVSKKPPQTSLPVSRWAAR